MSDRVQITIEGRETASRAFQQVASSADRMDQSLDRAEQSASRFSQAGAALGAVIGATSGLLSDSARAAAEAEVSQERLRAAIEASGATYEEYASQLEAAGEAAVAMGFDDEAALDSIARLTAATGDAGAAIENLGLIMDIARGRGIGLADATRIVEAVETGRMETLRRLGIVLDENATKEEALAELQQRYAGQAEAYADSAAGAYDRIRVHLGNLQETIGEHSGSMQLLLMSLPGLSAGYTAAAAAIGGLRSQLTATSATTVGMVGRFRLLATAATGLVASIGPVGLGAAALAAGGSIIYLISQTEGLVTSAEAAEESISDLEQTVRELFAAGDTLAMLGERGTEIFPGIADAAIRMEELERAIATTNAGMGQFGEEARIQAEEDIARWSEELYDLAFQFGTLDDSMNASTLSVTEVAEATDAFNQILNNTGAGAAAQQAALQGLVDLYDNGEIGAEALAASIVNLAGQTDYYNERATANVAALEDQTSALDTATAAAEAFAAAWADVTAREEERANARLATNSDRRANDIYDDRLALAEDTIDALGSQAAITRILSDEEAYLADAVNDVSTAMSVQLGVGEEVTANTAELVDALRNDLAATMDLVTGRFTATTNALDAGFRVIVGNTNAIASQSQAVADWATELIDVEGTYSQLDDLLANHTITQQQYVAAQRAHNTILADNAMIQNDILGIQAESAPVIASLMASQARYVNELQNAEPAAQALALAYMDTATSARALELAQIAASEAPGFEGLIEGAIAANPLIEAILTDMGIVSRGAEGELIINTEGETEVEALTTAIESLEDTIVSVFVEVDDSGLEGLRDRLNPFNGSGMMGDGGSGMAFNIAVTADTSEADARIDETTSKLSEWDGATATGELLADNGDATNKIEQSQSDLRSWGAATGTGRVLADSSDATSKMAAAQGSLRAWGSSSASARVNAQNNASGVIAAVSSQLAALNGRTATTYINTVYTTIGSPVGLGGVAGYAAGGVVAEMAEWGPELLHFPNGGVAIAPSRGLYAVPQGTYVDTAPATAAKMSGLGGLTVNLHVGGNVIGVDDLAAEVSTKIVPAIQRAYQQHARGYA